MKVRIDVDEVVILDGSTNDDGIPDAVVAWNSLREFPLKPTDRFEENVDKMTTIDGSLELSTFGTITVAYGGRKDFILPAVTSDGLLTDLFPRGITPHSEPCGV